MLNNAIDKNQIDPNLIKDLLFKHTSNLLGNFYEMQSSFLIGIYKRYKSIETAHIILYLAKNMHLEIIREREKNLDYNLSLEKFWDNFHQCKKPAVKMVSIVKMTGVPKETVRRKVSSLIKDKFIKVNDNKEYFWSLSPTDKDGYYKIIEDEILSLSKFISKFTKYVYPNLSCDLIEKEIKLNYSFYWYHFLDSQIKWLKMWTDKIKDIDLVLISLQAIIPTLQNINKYSRSSIDDLDNLYKTIGKTSINNSSKDFAISATSIAEISSIPRATCGRKLEKLVKLGLLIRETKTKRYFVNQTSDDRTKHILTKENVNFSVENFTNYMTIVINAMLRNKAF